MTILFLKIYVVIKISRTFYRENQTAVFRRCHTKINSSSPNSPKSDQDLISDIPNPTSLTPLQPLPSPPAIEKMSSVHRTHLEEHAQPAARALLTEEVGCVVDVRVGCRRFARTRGGGWLRECSRNDTSMGTCTSEFERRTTEAPRSAAP